jgi:hypothetical protein
MLNMHLRCCRPPNPLTAAVASQLADLAADCLAGDYSSRPDLATVVRPKLQQLVRAAALSRPSNVFGVAPPAEYMCPISQVSPGWIPDLQHSASGLV